MLYEPDWERLSLSLKRVTADGASEDTAKRAICNALADRKIAARLYYLVPPISINSFPRRELSARYTRDIRKEDIPTSLTPRDFDWTQSRIRKSEHWANVRGPFGSLVGHWEVIEAARHHPDHPLPESHRRHQHGLELPQATSANRIMAYWHRIELFRPDVTKVLCDDQEIRRERVPATINQESLAIRALASHLKSNPQMRRADADEWCEKAGHKLGKRAFERVWPQARGKAGLSPIAPPGRKPKSRR